MRAVDEALKKDLRALTEVASAAAEEFLEEEESSEFSEEEAGDFLRLVQSDICDRCGEAEVTQQGPSGFEERFKTRLGGCYDERMFR